MPIDPMMAAKNKPPIAIAVEMKGKMKPNTFTPPKGYASDTDDEVKEALLKFKENDDGTCEMISLDGAPFKDDLKDSKEEAEESPPEASQEDEMPADMPMEDAITTLQKRNRY